MKKEDLEKRVKRYLKERIKLLKKYGLREVLTITFGNKKPSVLAKVCMFIVRKYGGKIDTIWSNK